jgi:hypothetical protein
MGTEVSGSNYEDLVEKAWEIYKTKRGLDEDITTESNEFKEF